MQAQSSITYTQPSFPDAQKCTLLKRPDYAYVNFITHVTLTIRDQRGVPLPSESSDVTASLRCILSDSIMDCRISEHHMASDGDEDEYRHNLKISYMVESRGRFELHVKVKGEHIHESPFAIFAKVPPTTLGEPVRIIRGVKQPTSVAIGPNSECVVVEMSTSRVSIFNNSGMKIKTLDIGDASTKLFLAPSGISLDGSGNIYVVDQQKIMKISPMGKLMITSPYPQGGLSSLEMPSSISFAPNSNLHVCSPSNNEIITLDTELKVTKESSSKSGNFLHPRNIEFDTKGGRIRSFITDQGNHQVQVLDDQSGNHLFDIKAAANQKPWMPCGIFVDPRTDLVYVTDLANHQISIFCSSGEHVHFFGCEGKGRGEFSSPTGIAVDMDGFVYVCDSSNDCVQVFWVFSYTLYHNVTIYIL